MENLLVQIVFLMAIFYGLFVMVLGTKRVNKYVGKMTKKALNWLVRLPFRLIRWSWRKAFPRRRRQNRRRAQP